MRGWNRGQEARDQQRERDDEGKVEEACGGAAEQRRGAWPLECWRLVHGRLITGGPLDPGRSPRDGPTALVWVYRNIVPSP